MGRLIDADRLNKDFSLIITHIENSNKETISKKEFCKCLKILRECVNEQPTAYDVEKVVAELEERRSKFDCKYCKHYFNGKKECDGDCTDALIDDLFEIVRKGGVE